MNNEYYVIVFTDNEGKINYCAIEEGGYPFYSPDFTFDRVFYSKIIAQKAINCWNQFDMWDSKVGFTSNNISIKRLVYSLEDC